MSLSKLIAAVRREIVVIAGLATAALTFVVSNDSAIAAVIPILVSLLTRTQVSPLARLQDLLNLIGELEGKAKAAAPVAVVKAKAPRKPPAA